MLSAPPACYVDDAARQPMRIVNGRMTIPEGPGFHDGFII